MNAEFLDRIGDRNPQLYRELKGKFKRRNIIVTAIASFLFQAILIFVNTREIDGVRETDWAQIFQTLNWLLPIFAIASGVYLLSRDLCQEQIRGTLNFVRLSPQPSENILLGKMLGVPILLYLGLALMLPLHLRAGASAIAGLPAHQAFLTLFAVYPLWVALGSIFYNVAALLAVVNPKGDLKLLPATSSLLVLVTLPMALAISAANASVIWAFYPGVNTNNWNWFFLPESFSYFWLLATFFALNLGIWHLLNCSFRNPYGSAMTKAQSYWVVAGMQLWLLGFALPDAIADRIWAGTTGIFCLFAIAPITILMMSASLSPSRQTLLDWARYRHQQSAEKRGLLRDLLLGEKSPSSGAIAVHLGIIALIWLPWFALFVNSPNSSSAIDRSMTPLNFALSLSIGAVIFFIHATLNQTIRFHAKNIQQEANLSAYWFSTIFLPPMLATFCQLTPDRAPLLWLFSPAPILAAPYAATPILLAALVCQLALLSVLLRRLQQQIARAGASEFKLTQN